MSTTPPPPLPSPALLPDTLLSLVFDFLSAGQLGSLAPVCRDWHAVTRMPWLWRSWFMARWPHTALSAVGTPNDENEEEEGVEDDNSDAGGLLAPVASPRAAISHLLSDECAGEVEWRAAFHARAVVQSWSSAMFTPPRRRTPQAVAARPFVPSSAAMPPAPAGESVSPAPHSGGSAASASGVGSGGRSTHRNQRGGSVGSGGGGDSNLQRSRSTNWSEERSASAQQRQSLARRGSSGAETVGASSAAAASASAGDPVAPALNNHTPVPQRGDRTSGNLTALTHPNQRGVRHSPAPHAAAATNYSPMQRSRPLPIPPGSAGAGSAGRGQQQRPDRGDRDNNSNHSHSLPTFSGPSMSTGSPAGPRRLSGSPRITSPSFSGANLSQEFEELSLGSSALSAEGPAVGDSSLPLILTGHRAAVTCLHFDESRIGVCAGRDVRMYSLQSGKLLEQLCVLKTGLLTSLDFSSRLLVTGSTDCALRVFDLESMELQRVTARKQGHSDVVTAVRLSANERALLSVSLDASFKVFDVQEGQCISTINQDDAAHTGMLLCMDRVDEHTFLCGASGGSAADPTAAASARLALFDVRAGRVAHVQSVGSAARQQMVCSISYSASNGAVAAGGNDGSVHVLDIRMLADEKQEQGTGGGGSGSAKPVLIHVPAPTTATRMAAPPLAPSPPTGLLHFDPLDTANSSSGVTNSLLPPLTSPALSPSPPPVPLLLRAPVQSVHLDASRLLVCQKRALSVFSAYSSCSPLQGTGLPFAHLERQFGLEDAALFSRPTCNPALNAFHFMRMDSGSGTLALATTDAILVWTKQRHVFAMGGRG